MPTFAADLLPWISKDDLECRDVHREKELIAHGNDQFSIACPWCRRETDKICSYRDVRDGEEYAVLTCPECGREYVVDRNENGTPYACGIMSAADLRYLNWRKSRGLPGSYWELTP